MLVEREVELMVERATRQELEKSVKEEMEALSNNEAEATMRRRKRKLLSSMASADALLHASSDGSAAFAISSDVAVDVESVRFTDANVGDSGDPDVLLLSANLLTVNGALTVGAVRTS